METLEKLISKMTIEEKADMLTGSSNMDTAYIERLGIDPLTMCDGPHGVRIEGDKEANCTSFPCLSALGATWSREMARLMGESLGKECIQHNKAMLLGPGVNIKRTDLCGRNFEYFSEDPALSGEMASEYINGVQKYGVGACVKHFAVNNQETDRLYLSSEIDERTMREIYLKAFEIAIKKSNPASVMCAVNKVNAVLCSENKMLLTDILKEEWHYDGFVMSDWGCSKDAAKSVMAGLDLRMPKMENHREDILAAFNEGRVTEQAIDDAVYRVLKFIANHKKQTVKYNRDSQHEAVEKIAEESIVLLKNENDLLPITKEKYKRIVVVGEYAEKPVISGFGSARVFPNENYIDSPLDYIKQFAGEDIQIDYVPLYSTSEFLHESQFRRLSQLASVDEADLVVMFTGRQESVETEGSDRVTSHLDPLYEFFVKRIYPRNQNIVMVVQSGGAFLQLSWQNKVKGIVQMWLGGEAGGAAIAKVLFGKVNPSGKLSETFPIRTRNDIDYPGDGYKVSYEEKWRVGYRYYDLHPDEIWYPFGYGLSYAQFDYSNIEAQKTSLGVNVSFDLKNTGKMYGKEVVQLYTSDRISISAKPIKELRDFAKVGLAPGESKKVTFDLKDEQLAYYNITLKKWIIEPGTYDILIGASSRDIRLRTEYLYDAECEYTMQYNAEQIMG